MAGNTIRMNDLPIKPATDVDELIGIDKQGQSVRLPNEQNEIKTEVANIGSKVGELPHTSETADGDFTISDEYGIDIVRFQNGGIKTKNFNSEDAAKSSEVYTKNQVEAKFASKDDLENIPTEANTEHDFAISDENGTNIVEFADGHIRTKNFDSKNIPSGGGASVDNSNYPFAITDENDNAILAVQSGYPRTKNFDGKAVVEALNMDISKFKIMYIGSSTTAGTGSTKAMDGSDIPSVTFWDWIARKNNKIETYAYGVGGENCTTELGRVGSIPYVIDGRITLPADGSTTEVNIKSTWVDGATAERLNVAPLRQGGSTHINPCYVNSIACTLSYSSGKYYLKRNVATTNADVIIDGTIIETNVGRNCRPNIIVFHVVGNEHNADGNNERPLAICHKIRDTASFFGVKNYVVVGNHTGDYNSTRMIQERVLLDAFGERFINSREYISQFWLRDGVEKGYFVNDGAYPTAQDTIDMSNGKVASSIMADTAHMKQPGHKILGDIIYERLLKLKYIQ